MSETIWKFRLSDARRTDIELPSDAQPLSVQIQHGALQVWVRLNPELPRVAWRFFLYPTGGTLRNPLETYLGTVQFADGNLVAHVFYLAPQKQEASDDDTKR